MPQSLQDFLKQKGFQTPTIKQLVTPVKVGKPEFNAPAEFAKELPASGLKTLRFIGEQLMKPVGIVAKATEAVGQATRGEFEGVKALPSEALKIAKGEKEYGFAQLYREYLPEHKTAATVLGTVVDIAADPLNFVGGIVVKGLGLLEKGAQKVPLIQKGLKPVFSTKTSVKAVDTVIDQYKSLGKFREAEVIEGAREVQKAVSKLPKEDVIKVSNYIEKGVKSTPQINALGEKLQKTYSSWKALEKQLGVKGGEIAQYAPHIKAKTSLAESVKKAIFPSREWTTKLGGAEKGRQILKFVSKEGDELVGKAENLGLKEISGGYKNINPKSVNFGKVYKVGENVPPSEARFLQKIVEGYEKKGKVFQPQQASIDEIANAFGKHFFEENPAIQMAYRGIAHTKAVTSKEFFNAIRKFAVKDGAQVAVPELKGLKFSEDVARQVDNYYKGIQPEELKVIAKVYDTAQNWWKGQALIAPSYHLRNMVGNVWNNFLAGVKNPVSYIKAGMIQSGKGKDVRIAGMTADKLMDIAQKRGVVNQGWYAADIPTAVEQGIKNTWKQGVNPLAQQNYGFRLNKKVGSAFENNARLAHFIEKLEGGSSIDDAVLSVKKYLFDYQDLTNFEKNVLKRVFPFYTWTRKNIPLQLEHLIKQPGKYAGLEKVIRAVEQLSMGEAKPVNEKYLSDYIKNNSAMRARYNAQDNTYYYFLLGNWLPSYQAIDFLSQPLYNIMNMVTPIIKTPIDVLSNKSSFFRDTLGEAALIERYPGETTNYLGFNVPKKVATVLRNIRLLNELDKLNPGKIFGGEKGEPSVFKDLPAMGKITPAQYKYGKIAPAPTQAERTLGFLTGKLVPYKESEAKEFYQYDTERRINELKQAIKSASRKGDRERVKILQEELREFVKSR